MDSLILGLRVLVALGAVLGLMWFLQRRIGAAKGRGRRSAGRTLNVVSRQSVGQKASVVVIDAGDRRFLLGVTEHSINVLYTGYIPAETLEPTTAERWSASSAPGPQADTAGAGSFAALFEEAAGMPRRSQLHRRNGAHRPGPAGSAPAGSTPAGSSLHGSLLAGSTWRQAAEALRGRHN